MSRRMAPDSVPVGERGHEPLIKVHGQVLPFLALVLGGSFHFLPSTGSHRQFHLTWKKKGLTRSVVVQDFDFELGEASVDLGPIS